MKHVQHYSWGWWIFPPTPGIGVSPMTRNGKVSDLATVFLFTVFGWGVCVYDRQGRHGDFIVPKRHGFALGRFELGWSDGADVKDQKVIEPSAACAIWVVKAWDYTSTWAVAGAGTTFAEASRECLRVLRERRRNAKPPEVNPYAATRAKFEEATRRLAEVIDAYPIVVGP